MPAPEPIAEDRHGRILAELAGMSLELARDLQARALAAETSEEAARLSTAFHRISRGLRQTLALELKVARFRQDLARAAADDEARAAQARADAAPPDPQAFGGVLWKRRNDVAFEVEKLIYSEAEGEFDEARIEANQVRLNNWLAVVSERPGFADEDFDDQVIEACRAIGFDPGRLYIFDDEEGEGGDAPPGLEAAPPEGATAGSPDSS
jgi:hypothetical protein